ncbi:MAG: hypothetical protein G01um101430_752 [Parcubacteria group bacterium Gr01-1014_30]|nr:MAG: hypothetical protein G01um101430_752 [Parcubacteria group bacterium Gr01-1014_30]
MLALLGAVSASFAPLEHFEGLVPALGFRKLERAAVGEGHEVWNRTPDLDAFLASGSRRDDRHLHTVVRRVTLDGIHDVVPETMSGTRPFEPKNLLRTPGTLLTRARRRHRNKNEDDQSHD